jgi:hypothetical protein
VTTTPLSSYDRRRAAERPGTAVSLCLAVSGTDVSWSSHAGATTDDGSVGSIDVVSARIRDCAGQRFRTVNDLPFTHAVPGNYLVQAPSGSTIRRVLLAVGLAGAA